MAKDFNIYEDGNNVLTESVLNGIDTADILATNVSTYTAIQDCICAVYMSSGTSDNKYTRINNVDILQVGGYSSNNFRLVVMLKKGQVLSVGGGNANIYGIKR